MSEPNVTQAPSAASNIPRTLDVVEAATYLKVHPDTLKGLARSGTIRACKPGRAWVFRLEDLNGYLDSLSLEQQQKVYPIPPRIGAPVVPTVPIDYKALARKVIQRRNSGQPFTDEDISSCIDRGRESRPVRGARSRRE